MDKDTGVKNQEKEERISKEKNMITTENIRMQKTRIQNGIDRILQMTEQCPEGKLICRNRNGVFRYSYKETVMSNGSWEEKERYLKREDPLLLQLAKRDYYQQYLKDLKRELRATEEYLKWHQDQTEVSRYLEKHPGLRDLLPEALISEKNKYYQWANASYPRNQNHPEHLIFITDGGFYVRSKSEQLIANTMLAEGVPFRYEDPVYSEGGVIIYPDFHLYSLRDYKEWYLEHNGMMLKDEYYDHYIWKLGQLRSAGIIPGVNLLQTFEAEGHPLEPDYVRDLIYTYLK